MSLNTQYHTLDRMWKSEYKTSTDTTLHTPTQM
jgi:hypothetical protein